VPGAITVEGLVTGELVIDAASITAHVSLALPLDRTILFTSVREAEPSPTYGNTMCQLAMDGITCQRLTAGTDYAQSDGTIHVRWTVVTLATGVSVQRGLANTATGVPYIVTVTPVDPAASFLVMNGGYKNSGTGWGTDEFFRSRVVDGQTLEFTAVSSIAIVSWQLVTMTGASVQRGTMDFLTGDTEGFAPVGMVDPAHTFALVSNTEDSGVGLGAKMSMLSAQLVPQPGGDQMVHVARASGGAPVSAAWEVITVPLAVAHGVAVLTPGAHMVTTSAPGATAGSVALATGQAVLGASGGTTDYSDAATIDMVGEADATLAVTPTGITLERATSLSTTQVPWTEIDFASCQ
jgi:hypothetical protein